jgi:hypothetical protein
MLRHDWQCGPIIGEDMINKATGRLQASSALLEAPVPLTGPLVTPLVDRPEGHLGEQSHSVESRSTR